LTLALSFAAMTAKYFAGEMTETLRWRNVQSTWPTATPPRAT